MKNHPFKRELIFCRILPTAFLIVGILLNTSVVFSQGLVAQEISILKQKNVFKEEISPFAISDIAADPAISKTVSKFNLLTVTQGIKDIITSKPDFLKMRIPFENGSNVLVLLYKTNISPGGFNLLTNSGAAITNTDIVHYRGSIDSDSQSVASFTFSENETMGLISNNNGNYVLGKLENNNEGVFIIYNDKDLVPRFNFDCSTADITTPPNYSQRPNGSQSILATKCVNWYWEADYDVFVNKGSVANVNSYMQGVFNQVATLYANDGMTVNLRTVYVWTTIDPYTGADSYNLLNLFGTQRASGFDGDFGTLIGFSGNSGMAWANTYCYIPQYQTAYCGVSPSYNTVPTYSWTVENIAHENGHLLGSSHTHACVWNGNNTAIDGCYTPAGGCANPGIPAGGGTIMSYCNLTAAGINFSLGFGPQPKALLVNNINAASCLSTCASCTVPPQPGTITGNSSVCTSGSQTYSVVAVTGATSYSWTLPAGWIGTSTTNSISVITGAAGGNITVKANNSCGASLVRTLSVITAAPVQPGAISGSISICPGTSQTYSVTAVSGATSYTWILPAGWSGTSTTNAITLTTGTAGGNISVRANGSCGSSISQSLAIAITTTIPAQPATISGNALICPGTSQTYSVVAVTGATNYTWTLPPGWSGTSATNSISAISGTSGGSITVTANSSCGSSTIRSLAISISGSIPAQPGTISGIASVCPGTSQTYSVAAVTGAINYTWTLPTGWSGTSTTNSITAISGTSGGSITVTANSSCGSSTVRSLAVTITSFIPTQPGIISGTVSICSGTSQTYSVAAVTGATNYTWTLPTGWSGSSTTRSITVTSGMTSGSITVKANSSCGSSTVRSLAINISGSIPAQPGTISGAASLCPGTSQTYSVAAVSGATNYTWTLPSGWSGSSTTNSITAISGISGGSVTVKANSSCGSSTIRLLAVAISGNIPAQPGSISGTASVCSGISQTYSVAAVTGAANYTWTLPTGWSGSSTTNSITATSGLFGGSITVKANGSCGNSTARSIPVSITGSIPIQPGNISGNTALCSASSQTYSVAAVTGATNYTWTLPTGWSGNSTTNSITATTGTSGGSIIVKANNSCGSSVVQSLIASVAPIALAQPSAISGSSSVCTGATQTFSVTSVTGASGYTWTLPTGWSGNSTTAALTATAGVTGGTISVKANNTCGSSIARTFLVATATIPLQPSAISGAMLAYPSVATTYSIAAVAGASGYTWTLPVGWTGSSSTSSITAVPNNNGGTISVKANNTCGSSAARSFSVTMGSILPLRQLSLKGQLVDGAVELTWRTSNEGNWKRFEIEKSMQGGKYSYVGMIVSKGNTSSIIAYGFADNNPYPGFSSYRLKIIDGDGNFSYSDIAIINNDKQLLRVTALYPNPTTAGVKLEIVSAINLKLLMCVFDIQGKKLMEKKPDLKKGFNEAYFSLTALSPGTYILIFRDEQNKVIHKANVIKL